jgi:hypothetical protein
MKNITLVQAICTGLADVFHVLQLRQKAIKVFWMLAQNFTNF